MTQPRYSTFLILFLTVLLLHSASLRAQQGFANPIFDPLTPEQIPSLQLLDTLADYQNEDGWCTCSVRLFSADGRVLATERRIKDMVSGVTFDFADQGYPIALSPDGRYALVAGDDAGTRLLDIPAQTLYRLMDADAEGASFSPDGTLMAISSRDADAVQIWEAETRLLVASLGSPERAESPVFSPNGQVLFYFTEYFTLNRWEVGGGVTGQVLTEAVDYTLSPSGETLIARDFDYVELWDVASGERMSQVEDTVAEASGVEQAVLSPDEQRLAISFYGSNNRVELWNVSLGEPEKLADVSPNSSAFPIFTLDNQFLLLTGGGFQVSCDRESSSCSSGFGNTVDEIRILDARDGTEINAIAAEGTYRSALSPDGRLLIISSYWGDVRVWAHEDGQLSEIAQLPGREFVFSPDGATLVVELTQEFLGIYGVASDSRSVRTFQFPSTIVPSSTNVRAEPDGEAAVINTVGGDVRVFGRSEDGAHVYLPDQEGWVRADPLYLRLAENIAVETLPVFNERALEQEATLILTAADLAIEEITITAETQPIVVSTSLPTLAALQLDPGTPILTPVSPQIDVDIISTMNVSEVTLLGVLPQSYLRPRDFPVRIPALSADGTRLSVPPTETDYSVRIWDVHTLETVARMPLPEPAYSSYGSITSSSPDGHTVAHTPSYYNQALQLWRLEGEEARTIGDAGLLFGFRQSPLFSPDGRTLALPGVLLYDVPSASVRAALSSVGEAIFSPDSVLTAVVEEERVYIVDVETGSQVASTPRQTDYPFQPQTAVFSPDNQWFAVVSDDETTLYQTQTGTSVAVLPAVHSVEYPQVRQVVFTPDGRYLLELTQPDSLTVFDLEQRAAVGAYTVSDTQHIAFSPDGTLVAIGNPLRLIDLTTGMEYPIAGNYAADYLAFSHDGATLLVEGSLEDNDPLTSVMVFGVPDTRRTAWKSISVQIGPSAINARQQPDGSSPVVGAASGEVEVSARNRDGTALYVPGLDGWIWAAPEYVELGQITLDTLPVRHDRQSDGNAKVNDFTHGCRDSKLTYDAPP